MRWSSCPGRRQAATGSVAGAAGGARRLGLEQELPGELTPIVLPLAEEESGLFIFVAARAQPHVFGIAGSAQVEIDHGGDGGSSSF
jgi:hypothetical protein